MPYFRGSADRYLWLAGGAALLVAAVSTGFFVGVAQGRHEAKQSAWRECERRYETAVARERLTLVRRADPCETWR